MTKQREIKFRAWYKNSEDALPVGMYEVIGITKKYSLLDSWHDLEQVQIFSPKDGKNKEGFGLTVTLEEIELMQYTGLKDSKGVEIFEADIIENDSEWYEIVWDDDQLLWLAQDTKGYPVHLSELGNNTFVQGNIHQNPELLK